MIEVGGDIYDIHKFENKIGIFLADTTAHRVMAALTTMLIKGEYDFFKEKFADPVELFSTLNEIIFNTYQTLSISFTGIIIDFDLTNGIMWNMFQQVIPFSFYYKIAIL